LNELREAGRSGTGEKKKAALYRVLVDMVSHDLGNDLRKGKGASNSTSARGGAATGMKKTGKGGAVIVLGKGVAKKKGGGLRGAGELWGGGR